MYGSAEIRATEYTVEVRGQFSGVSSSSWGFTGSNSKIVLYRKNFTHWFLLTNAKFFSLYKQILTIYCCSFFLSWTESWYPWSCYSLYSRGWPHTLNTLCQAIKMEITWTFVIKNCTFKHNYTKEHRMIWIWTTTGVENINNSIKANYLNYVAKYKNIYYFNFVSILKFKFLLFNIKY